MQLRLIDLTLPLMELHTLTIYLHINTNKQHLICSHTTTNTYKPTNTLTR